MKTAGVFLLLLLDELLVGVCVMLALHYYTDLGWQAETAVLAVVLAVLAFAFYMYSPHFRTPHGGREELAGMSGTVVKELNPEGQVKIKGKLWTAEATEDVIATGEEVKVVDMEGLTLIVQRTTKENTDRNT